MASDGSSGKVPSYTNIRNRAFRISLIPVHITRSGLLRCLEDLPFHSQNSQQRASNIHALSLVHEAREQVATVVFYEQPECLEECIPGNVVEICLHIDDVAYHVKCDSDFFGLTPLYTSPDDVGVE